MHHHVLILKIYNLKRLAAVYLKFPLFVIALPDRLEFSFDFLFVTVTPFKGWGMSWDFNICCALKGFTIGTMWAGDSRAGKFEGFLNTIGSVASIGKSRMKCDDRFGISVGVGYMGGVIPRNFISTSNSFY